MIAVHVLQSMDIDKVANFPFPTRPDTEAIVAAETLLTHLGALDVSASSKKGKEYHLHIL